MRWAPAAMAAAFAVACATAPAGTPGTGAAVEPKAPAPPRTFLLAPIDAQGVAEPARSRARAVTSAVARYLKKRGVRIERLSFEAYRALLAGTAPREEPFDAIVRTRLVQKKIQVKGSPKWDGVYRRIPTKGLPGDQYPARLRANLEVLSVSVELLAPDGKRLHRGLGGLDHLQRIRLEGSYFHFEVWPDTLTRKKRIDEGVNLALRGYFDS